MSARLVYTLGLALALAACEKKSTAEKAEPTAEPAAATQNMIGTVAVKKPSTVVSPGTGGGKQPGESTGPTKKPGGGGNDVSPVQSPH
jgi:hypothetical protein